MNETNHCFALLHFAFCSTGNLYWDSAQRVSDVEFTYDRQGSVSATILPYPDSRIDGANMGPTWVLSAPGGPHVGPINLVNRVMLVKQPWKTELISRASAAEEITLNDTDKINYQTTSTTATNNNTKITYGITPFLQLWAGHPLNSCSFSFWNQQQRQYRDYDTGSFVVNWLSSLIKKSISSVRMIP